MSEPAAVPAAAPAPAWRVVLRWALSLGLLAVVGAQLAGRWDAIAAQVQAFDPRWFAASLAALALYFALSAEAWRRLLAALGGNLTWAQAFHASYYANVAKYLPGSVWGLVGRVVLTTRLGVPAGVASAAVLMDAVCQVVAGVLVGLLALPAFMADGGAGPFDRSVAVPVAIAIAGAVVAMHPRVLNGALGLAEALLTRLGKPRALPRVPYRYGFVIAMLALYTLNWALMGLGFAALGQALAAGPLAPGQLLLLAGAFTIAWNVGVFALFAPGGLGVREAALALLLAPAFPAGWPALAALVGRAWIVLGEGLAFAVAVALGGPAQGAGEAGGGPTRS